MKQYSIQPFVQYFTTHHKTDTKFFRVLGKDYSLFSVFSIDIGFIRCIYMFFSYVNHSQPVLKKLVSLQLCKFDCDTLQSDWLHRCELSSCFRLFGQMHHKVCVVHLPPLLPGALQSKVSQTKIFSLIACSCQVDPTIYIIVGRSRQSQLRLPTALIRYHVRKQIQAFQRLKSAFYVKNQSIFVPLVREQIQVFQRLKSEFYIKNQ